MSLEIEKLLTSLDLMARSAAKRRQTRRDLVAEALDTLEERASAWTTIEAALAAAGELADPKHYHSARPVDRVQPLNATIDPPLPPSEATLISTDGSQIMPDRHAAHLYYLINVGGIVYHHVRPDQAGGSPSPLDGPSPEPFSQPELHFPRDELEALAFSYGSSDISIERDLKEIDTLADKAAEHRNGRYLLALLDQRLLYWPIGGSDTASNAAVKRWLAAMARLRESGAALAGYIVRPMTSSVLNLLQAVQGLDDPAFDWKSLGRHTRTGLTDAALFSHILEPGQRSKVFVNISPTNERFAEYDPLNRVCFFYMNPGQSGHRVARIDIPLWVAQDEYSVSAAHALIYDQCQILGDYPYVIARADEMAVVGKQEHRELDFMIDLHMQRHGMEPRLTAKQGSKSLARGAKSRHGI
jgi:hypothetical protein